MFSSEKTNNARIMSLFQAHIGVYNAIKERNVLDRHDKEAAAEHKRSMMDLMVLFIAKENLPVRIVESKHLMRLLQGEHLAI